MQVPLPEPDTTGTTSLEKAIAARRSVRGWVEGSLTMSEVAQLLWAAQGITDQRGYRSAPSAGALYPLEAYLLTADVQGLDQGVYHYLPRDHALEMLYAGDCRAELASAALSQDFIGQAPASLLIAAVPKRTTDKYGSRGHQYVYMEAGHAAQNVCLQCVTLGLGTVTVGAFHEKAVTHAAHLPTYQVPLYIMPVGRL